MNKPIFYKEWLKSRKFAFIMLLVLLAVSVYSFIDFRHSIRFAGKVHLLQMVVQKNIIFFALIKWPLLATGIGLAISQYIPEILQRRLKLTLHLPQNRNRIIWLHIAYGFMSYLLLSCITVTILLTGTRMMFPAEIVSAYSQALLPWVIGGWTSYALTSFILLETNWTRRIAYVVAGVFLIQWHFLSPTPGAYQFGYLFLLLLTLIATGGIHYAIMRFKIGANQ